MHFILIAFLSSLIYYLGIKINYLLFIKIKYKKFLKEGLTKEESYTEAKLMVDYYDNSSFFMYFSWITTIILLSYKGSTLFDSFIDKKIKQNITK